MTTVPNLTALPANPTVPASKIQSRQQLEAVVENIVQLQRERDELHRAQENKIAAIRHRYRASLAEIENYLDLETGWAEIWAAGNRDTFNHSHGLHCDHAILSFHAEPLRLERASRRWTWTRIAAALSGLSWGGRYLRTPPPDVDKEALIADLANLSQVELRNAGMLVIQGERFVITPHPPNENAWREAA